MLLLWVLRKIWKLLRGGFLGAESLPPVSTQLLFSPCEEEVQAEPHPATQMALKCLSQRPRKGARPDLTETKRKKKINPRPSHPRPRQTFEISLYLKA